jgi:hypothetical protein
MTRIIVCSTLLIGFIAGLRWLLNGAFDHLGFAAGVTICIAATVVMISLGFAWDRYERSRSQQ